MSYFSMTFILSILLLIYGTGMVVFSTFRFFRKQVKERLILFSGLILIILGLIITIFERLYKF